MKLKPARQPESACVFCGSQKELRMDEQLTFSLLLKPQHRVCAQCHQSRDDREPSVWFGWLKRNDPEHWQRIVDHNRLSSRPFTSQVLCIRADNT